MKNNKQNKRKIMLATANKYCTSCVTYKTTIEIEKK